MTPPHRPFAAGTRQADLIGIGSRRFDLVVIGGGITGCGIALDAVTRGLGVVLVEAGDIGSGTSSRSSRLVHGGLRYLETLDFGLVFEASAERRRLLRLASHLVRPLPFLFPIWRGDRVGPARLRAGLWLYDALSLRRNVQPHRMLRRKRALDREPGLRSEGLVAAGLYHDAAVDDGRLTLAVARAAHDAGAVVLPRTRVTGFIEEDAVIVGVRVHDELAGSTITIRAKVVVNATGPWSDEVRRISDPGTAARLRPTKGVHVMVPRERVGNRGALIFPSAVDGRVMFILPWRGRTYIGTTDTEHDGTPESAEADRADVDYLLRSANVVFPSARLEPEDVISTWAGVRPLLGPPADAPSASAISREHAIWTDPGGLVNAAGGKLTTYRAMAEEVVDFAADILLQRWRTIATPSMTARLPIAGSPDDLTTLTEAVTRELRELEMPPELAIHLVGSHGSAAYAVLQLARERPELRHPLVDGLPYLWAEVSHAARAEMVLALDDVFRRRTHVFFEATDAGMGIAPAVARFLATDGGLGWDDDEIERQLDLYRREVSGSRAALRTA
jgi:glycerol-3-phosphate dehydrogenase